VAPADVKPGQIFEGGVGTNNGEQTGSVNAIDVATGKQIAKQPTPFPMYSGVMATPDLLWAGSLDGTFAAYDAKTLQVKWSINVGTGFQGSPIAFNAGGKEYIAIVGGGPGLATFGNAGLAAKSTANIVWVFGL
jgi:alcohol dehydrogenase (cytochrome c)